MQIHGNQHPETGTAHNNLAVGYFRMGNFAEAAKQYQAALTVQRGIFADDHPSVSVIQNNLAAMYLRMGRPDEALPLAEDALRKRRSTLGDKHLEVGVTTYQRACAYRDLGRFAEADEGFLAALTIIRDATGPRDRRVGSVLNGMAESKLRQHALDQAEELAAQALSINQQGWPEGHRSPAESGLLLARIALTRGDFEQARSLAETAEQSLSSDRGARFEFALATAVRELAMLRLGMQSPDSAQREAALVVLGESPRSAALDLSAFNDLRR
jgi:tetratricopeptide (TPR) repeat protein